MLDLENREEIYITMRLVPREVGVLSPQLLFSSLIVPEARQVGRLAIGTTGATTVGEGRQAEPCRSTGRSSVLR